MISLRSRHLFQLTKDRASGITSALCALTTTLVVGLIIFFLIYESLPALSNIQLKRFFSDPSWHPETQAIDGVFLVLPMITGTLLVTICALAISIPLGILTAIFCELYAPRFIKFITQRILELLSGIPTVVLGLWGLVVLVPLIQKVQGHGASILAGSIVLSIMILPTIALNSLAAISTVAKEHQLNIASLGLSKSNTVTGILLPLARRGIGIGILLAGARAIGETMVVVMLCGNMSVFPSSIFDPAQTLTATIALEMGYSYGDHRGALFFIGLLLMAIIFSILIIISLVKNNVKTKQT